MCNKTVDNYAHALEFVPDCCKTQEMCNKAANTSPSAIQFVPECYKIQEMCVKAVDTCPFVFNSVPDQYKMQEMCDIAVLEDPFMLKYCLDRYNTQEICDKPIDDFLPALKFAPDWFVTSEIIKKLQNALFTDDNRLFFDEDSGNVTFSSDKIGILNADLNNINRDGNFDEDDPETIIHPRLMAWHNRLKQCKAFKIDISKELMPVAWTSNKMMGLVLVRR